MRAACRECFNHSRKWIILSCGAFILACVGLVAMLAPAGAADSPGPAVNPYYSVAQNYTIRYYPRFLTYFQQSLGGYNRLVGPRRVSPVYGIVVSINVDTIYASFYLNLSHGPQIFTIPKTVPPQDGGVRFSLLTLDVFGDTFTTTPDIQPQPPAVQPQPGTYALVPKGWNGTLPPGITNVIQVPYPVTTWIIRADKYSSTNQNQIAQARAFRRGLRLASLQKYMKHPLTAGATKILPEVLFAPRGKAIADDAVMSHTTAFFRVLQSALSSPTTAPLSESDQALSNQFNQLYAEAKAATRRGNSGPLSQMIAGARAAHAMILANWLSLADANHWIYDSNFANWGTDYLDRASGSEWIQYGNGTGSAGYYNVFADGTGAPLNGSKEPAYHLTFAAGTCRTGCIPEAKRFWSLTAYLPRGNTLVPNAAMKYDVARYTPGLVTNRNGSITICIQTRPPAARLSPNWLPVPRAPFDLLLRVYGPEGNTAPPTQPSSRPYYPPKIKQGPC